MTDESAEKQNISISFIIPTHNSASFIHLPIYSILDQEESYFNKIEIIIVDDASTDNTVEVVKKILRKEVKEKKKPNLKYKVIKLSKNKGPGFARNTGIKKARGDYLLFLDSDDAIAPNLLEVSSYLVSKYLPDLLKWETITIKQNNYYKLIKNYRLKKNYPYDIFFINQTKEFGAAAKLLRDIPMGSYTLHKDLIKEYNLKFPVGFRTFEDIEFSTKALIVSKKILSLKHPMLFRILREDSYSKKLARDFKSVKDIYKYAIRTRAFLEKLKENKKANGNDNFQIINKAIIEKCISASLAILGEQPDREIFRREYPEIWNFLRYHSTRYLISRFVTKKTIKEKIGIRVFGISPNLYFLMYDNIYKVLNNY